MANDIMNLLLLIIYGISNTLGFLEERKNFDFLSDVKSFHKIYTT